MATTTSTLLTLTIIELCNFLPVNMKFGGTLRNEIFFHAGSVSGSSGTNIAGFTNAGGSGFSELNGPTAIFITSDGIMYIFDSLNYRVQKWIIGEPLGFTVAGGGGLGTTLDKIAAGNGLYVDDQSNIYVSENNNNRVTLWTNGNTTVGRIVCAL